MIVSIEEVIADLEKQGQCACNDGRFRMTNDLHVTPTEWTIRKFSLDKLPQLLIVSADSMSLRGYHPPLPQAAESCDSPARRKYASKRGSAGLRQVSGQSPPTGEGSVRLELSYGNWSLPSDGAILARAAKAMLVIGKTAH